MNDSTIKVTLELELAGESLSGRVLEPAADQREFSGWIGLVGVIDGLLAGATVTRESRSEED